MELNQILLKELQKRLKIGNRRGVHLNAIPSKSRYKFDIKRLSSLNQNLPEQFIQELLTEQPLKFKISWKNNVSDLSSLFDDDPKELVLIKKIFENLVNQTEAIESEKGINTFGFGFPILIRRNQSDNEITVAPILIWSLRIKRTKEFNTWVISRNEDDAIYLNEVLINHLESDSRIRIEQIPSEMLDDGLINKTELIQICANLLKSINTIVPSDVEKSFNDKLNNLVKIGDKNHYEKKVIEYSTNADIEFGGLFSIFEVQKQNIINDYNHLMELKGLQIGFDDLKDHHFQSLSSVETDPSQQNILHSLETKRNILIQGPPGTGKSQTLTAILINALQNHKKTIVVCEKRTALEVLHNALTKEGLGSQCIVIQDVVRDRASVVNSVRDRVNNTSSQNIDNYSKQSLANLIKQANDLINSINAKHQKLDKKILDDKSWTDVVGIYLSELKLINDEASVNIDDSIFDYTSQEYYELLNLIEKGQSLYNEFKKYESLSFLNSEKLSGTNLFALEQEIKQSFKKYRHLFNELIELEVTYRNEYKNKRQAELSEQIKQCNEIQAKIVSIAEDQKDNKDFYDEQKTSTFTYVFLSIFSKKRKRTIENQKNIKELFLQLENCYSSSKDLESISFKGNINNNLRGLQLTKYSIQKTEEDFQNKIEKEYSSLNILDFESKIYSTVTLTKIKDIARNLKETITQDAWVKYFLNRNTFKSLIENVRLILEKSNEYFVNESEIFPKEFKWFQFYNSLNTKEKRLIDGLKPKASWRQSFLVRYLNTLLINSSNTALPTDDKELSEFINILNKIKYNQRNYIKNYWRSEESRASLRFQDKNPNLSIQNLYNKRSSKNYKRLSLRQIIQYDANLFSTFFPIVLTSPDICCNLFREMNGYFDIVMFDEASQLRLEDNLPAILKGKQIVIAGDEHQMPPSNYFSKIFDGLVEDEEDIDGEDEINLNPYDILLGCESLLDFASELRFEKRFLDFHYRSRHPYLIDFSNYAFYQQRLQPMPNKFDYTPIKYIQVNGTFSGHTNQAEAEMVLSIVEKNIHRLPNGSYPTVGIATFNITQRDLIKSKILERQKIPKYSDFNDKIQELEENGMFVKNLENIQGDERDVIILSTTYGIGGDGKFANRFGPINHSKGYKLLNVIITRAKYKVYVCSSIPEQAFMNYKGYLDVEGNNKRAVFFAYLAYCKAVSENNKEWRESVLKALEGNSGKGTPSSPPGLLESPFEEEVYQVLADNFDGDKLIPQLQYAGFRIDIVYDSKKADIPKIAIECDGAKYHSSREAYLYDHYRQKILEDHGFVFHRIWSTNWWRNPKREATKLIEFINSIESGSNYQPSDYSNEASAFTDDIEMVKTNLAKKTNFDSGEESEIIEIINNQIVNSPISKNHIRLNSKVTVYYINTGKEVKVHIVDSTNKNEIVNGVQRINYKSPLAMSLMGQTVGEIVKIGNLDNFVEIKEVIN
jgi:superfamily I DNA and/or RNA helicase/transcription elongation GreA/GreB family factor/very-short-patch-repair endonuclease